MNIVRLGTAYGGWAFDLDSINDGDVILDCGVGNDVSFAEELLKIKNVKFVFVDPGEDNLNYARSRIPNATYIQAAVTKETSEVDLFLSLTEGSHSLIPQMSIVGNKSIKVSGVKLSDLLQQYNPSIVKLDIEGSEYDVFQDLFLYPAKQIAIEFHKIGRAHV